MPIKWRCPGQPKCQKTFQYAPGMKAHISSCRHAQSKRVASQREQLETMLSIIEFVENQQKGNVTVARRDVVTYRKDQPFLNRI